MPNPALTSPHTPTHTRTHPHTPASCSSVDAARLFALSVSGKVRLCHLGESLSAAFELMLFSPLLFAFKKISFYLHHV